MNTVSHLIYIIARRHLKKAYQFWYFWYFLKVLVVGHYESIIKKNGTKSQIYVTDKRFRSVTYGIGWNGN
jgi:hypothetical protein